MARTAGRSLELLSLLQTADRWSGPELAARVFKEELEYYLRDNTQAWRLQPDGSYVKIAPADGEAPFCAQAHLLAKLCRKR